MRVCMLFLAVRLDVAAIKAFALSLECVSSLVFAVEEVANDQHKNPAMGRNQ